MLATMRANVKSDRTVRTIQIEVEPGSVPDIDVTGPWHRKPRIFRPDLVTLTVTDGEVSRVNVSGGLVLKSGAASTEVHEKQCWYSSDLTQRADQLPVWVRTLMFEAPDDVITWRHADLSEEVQAL